MLECDCFYIRENSHQGISSNNFSNITRSHNTAEAQRTFTQSNSSLPHQQHNMMRSCHYMFQWKVDIQLLSLRSTTIHRSQRNNTPYVIHRTQVMSWRAIKECLAEAISNLYGLFNTGIVIFSFLGTEYANHFSLKQVCHSPQWCLLPLFHIKTLRGACHIPQQMAGANIEWQASISAMLKTWFHQLSENNLNL